MSNPARYLPRFLGAAALTIALAVLLNFAVDPLQLFRPARLFAAMYSQDARMQNAGLIRSQQFDTVFMGTSLGVHYRQSDIDRALGVRSLKLAMTGSNSKEQRFVLDAALERHRSACSGRWTTGFFATRRMSTRTSTFRPISIGGMQGHRGLSVQRRHGARIAVDRVAVDSAAAADRRAADHRRDVQISRSADVDDINALRPDFDVAGILQREKRARRLQAHHRPGAAVSICRKATITTRWSGISNGTPSA